MNTTMQNGFLSVSNIEKSFKATRAVNRISFSLSRGEFLTLLGPSGCGKTTTLRAIAGFESIDSGRIAIGGEVVSDPDAGINVPPEKRNLGMVFQSYAVWPHMTVAENVAYGLHRLKLPAAQAKERVRKVLAMVGLEGQIDRPATMLSGGQQQRVALARAIVYEPQVLLFDEPLSNLDAKLRERMRLELRQLQDRLGITSVYVTHDQEEAMVVSDRVIVMNLGEIQQIGTPSEIYDRPANRFVAEFVGSTNIFEGVVKEMDRASAMASLEVKIGDRACPVTAVHYRHLAVGQQAFVSIRDERIGVYVDAAGIPASWSRVDGTVSRRINMGSYFDYRVTVNGAEVSVRSARNVSVGPDDRVILAFAPEDCISLPD